MTLKRFLKSAHFRDQVRSTVTDVLMVAFVLFSGDATALLSAFYSGDFSKTTLLGLATLFFRSIVKANLIHFFPKIFPKPSFDANPQD